MREPGAVLLLSLVITVAIRSFWVKIVQLLIFLAILAAVTGVVSLVSLMTATANG